jgi:hypothetical protein
LEALEIITGLEVIHEELDYKFKHSKEEFRRGNSKAKEEYRYSIGTKGWQLEYGLVLEHLQ